MGCLIALVAMVSPRLAFALLWIFSNRVDIAFDGFFVPFLGLVFLPCTSLIYALAYAPIGGVSTLGWVFVIIGFFADIASYGAGDAGRRSR